MQPDPKAANMAGGNIPVYSFSLGGLVFNPSQVTLSCAYPYDVGSLWRTCIGQPQWSCIPGCTKDGITTWCNEGMDPSDTGAPCAWAPRDLRLCMEGRDELARRGTRPTHKKWDDHKFYAELIFDVPRYEAALPHPIEAVFFLWDGLRQRGMDCADAHDGTKCETYARAAHQRILEYFNLEAYEVPLVTLDLWNWERPFAPAPSDYGASGVPSVYA